MDPARVGHVGEVQTSCAWWQHSWPLVAEVPSVTVPLEAEEGGRGAFPWLSPNLFLFYSFLEGCWDGNW